MGRICLATIGFAVWTLPGLSSHLRCCRRSLPLLDCQTFFSHQVANQIWGKPSIVCKRRGCTNWLNESRGVLHQCRLSPQVGGVWTTMTTTCPTCSRRCSSTTTSSTPTTRWRDSTRYARRPSSATVSSRCVVVLSARSSRSSCPCAEDSSCPPDLTRS